MKRIRLLSLLVLLFMFLSACTAAQDYDTQSTGSSEGAFLSEIPQTESEQSQSKPKLQRQQPEKEGESVKIQITVGDINLVAIPEENSSAAAFLAILQEHPITIQMSDYAGMEKVGPLGSSLPRNDKRISVDAGDVILYQGNQITIYYGTNSWSFTKLAVIENSTRESLLEMLGTGDVEVTFSLIE